MLQSGGEVNPGPAKRGGLRKRHQERRDSDANVPQLGRECPHKGKFVKPERVVLHGKMLRKCPSCPMTLSADQEMSDGVATGKFFHPMTVSGEAWDAAAATLDKEMASFESPQSEDESPAGQAPSTPVQAPLPPRVVEVPSAPPKPEEPTPAAAVVATAAATPVARTQSAPLPEFGDAQLKATIRCSRMAAWGGSAELPGPTIARLLESTTGTVSVSNPVQPVPATVGKAEDKLSGHVPFTEEERDAVVAQTCGSTRLSWWRRALDQITGSSVSVSVETSELAKRPFDDRLVVDRNVKLTDRPIDVATITVVDNSFSVLLAAGKFAAGFLGGFAVTSTARHLAGGLGVVGQMAVCAIAGVTLYGMSTAMDELPDSNVVTVHKLPFVPHALSCAMREYKVADAKNIDATVEQKLLRLATLPVPAELALAYHQGTAAVARALSHVDQPGFRMPVALAPKRLRVESL